MKKKLIILTVMLTAFLSAAFAGNEDNVLIVTQKNGAQTVFAFEKKPVISYQGETMVITTTGSSSYSFPIADVKNYAFGNAATIIDSPKGDKTLPVLQNGHVRFQKMTDGQTVDVYSIDGRMVRSLKANDKGMVDIDLTSLPKGTLIIKSPATQIKVLNK